MQKLGISNIQGIVLPAVAVLIVIAVVFALSGDARSIIGFGTGEEQGQTASIVVGDSSPGSIGSKKEKDFWLFDGNAGDKVIVYAKGGEGFQPSIDLYNTMGQVVKWNDGGTGGTSTISMMLEEKGQYKAQVWSYYQTTGSYTVGILADTGSESAEAVSAVNLIGDQIEVGKSVEGEIKSAGAIEYLILEGKKDQEITVTMAAISPGLEPSLDLLAENNTNLTYNDGPKGGQAVVTHVLPSDGKYQIKVWSYPKTKGSYKVTVEAGNTLVKAAPIQSLNPGGGEITSGTTVKGVIGKGSVHEWTFEGEVGDMIVVSMDATVKSLSPSLDLILPGGIPSLYHDGQYGGQALLNEQLFVSEKVDYGLKKAGTYTLKAWSYSGSQGEYDLKLDIKKGKVLASPEPTPAPLTESPVAGTTLLKHGDTLTGSLQGPNDYHVYVFEGEADQYVTVHMKRSGESKLDPQIRFFGPEYRQGTSQKPSHIKHWNEGVQAQEDLEKLSVQAYLWTLDDTYKGEKSGTDTDKVPGARVDHFRLEWTGLYAVGAWGCCNFGDKSKEGEYTISLELTDGPSGIDRGTISSGVTDKGSIEKTFDRDLWTFEGTEGEYANVTVVPEDGSPLASTISVYSPDGQELVGEELLGHICGKDPTHYWKYNYENCKYGVRVHDIEMKVGGEYTVAVGGTPWFKTPDGSSPTTGKYSVELNLDTKLAGDPKGEIPYLATIDGKIETPGEMHIYSFEGTAGGDFKFTADSDGVDAVIEVMDPYGKIIIGGVGAADITDGSHGTDSFIDLRHSGTHLVRVSLPPEKLTGEYSLSFPTLIRGTSYVGNGISNIDPNGCGTREYARSDWGNVYHDGVYRTGISAGGGFGSVRNVVKAVQNPDGTWQKSAGGSNREHADYYPSGRLMSANLGYGNNSKSYFYPDEGPIYDMARSPDHVPGETISRHEGLDPDRPELPLWITDPDSLTWERVDYSQGDPDVPWKLLSNDAAVAYTVGAAGGLAFSDIEMDDEAEVEGLRNALSVVVSPDGRHVYTAGYDDNAIVVFSRSNATGALSIRKVHSNGKEGIGGINGVRSVAVSPDGKHVYAAGEKDNALAVFSRDSSTGDLTFVENVKDGVNGVDGLHSVRSAVVSPDGKNVYAAGYWDDSVAVFSRDASTGALTFFEVHEGAYDKSGVDGLYHAVSVVVSPDGEHVYAAGYGENAVVVFERDTSTGALTFREAHKDDENGVDGLQSVGSGSVAVSPDSKHVYAAGYGDDAVAVFSKDISSGGLTFVEVHRDGENGADGLDAVRSVTVSPDGNYVYVAGTGGDAIAVFERDSSTGALTFLQARRDGGIKYDSKNTPFVEGINGARSVAVSPDSNYVYAVGYTEYFEETWDGIKTWEDKAPIYASEITVEPSYHVTDDNPEQSVRYVRTYRQELPVHHPATGTIQSTNTTDVGFWDFIRTKRNSVADGRPWGITGNIGYGESVLTLKPPVDRHGDDMGSGATASVWLGEQKNQSDVNQATGGIGNGQPLHRNSFTVAARVNPDSFTSRPPANGDVFSKDFWGGPEWEALGPSRTLFSGGNYMTVFVNEKCNVEVALNDSEHFFVSDKAITMDDWHDVIVSVSVPEKQLSLTVDGTTELFNLPDDFEWNFIKGNSELVTPASDWIIDTVQGGEDVGMHTGMDHHVHDDGQSLMHIVYFNDSTDDLNYIKFNTATGTSTSPETPANWTNFGRYADIDVTQGGGKNISYLIKPQNSDEELGYSMSAVLSEGWTWWVPDQIMGPGAYETDVGQTTSVVTDSSGAPHIVYYDPSLGLRHTWGTEWNATTSQWSWDSETVDDGASQLNPGRWDVGRYASLGIDSDDNLHIVYHSSEGVFKHAYGLQTALNMWDWTLNSIGFSAVTVVNLGSGGAVEANRVSTSTVPYYGAHTSIGIDSDGRPYTSYLRRASGNLRFALGYWDTSLNSGSGGWSWKDHLVDDEGTVGSHVSLVVESEKKVHISYYDETNKALKYAMGSRPDEWSPFNWRRETVDDPADGSDVGKYTSIAVDETGNVHIAYYDETNKDLKLARQDFSSGWISPTVDNSLGLFGRGYFQGDIDWMYAANGILDPDALDSKVVELRTAPPPRDWIVRDITLNASSTVAQMIVDDLTYEILNSSGLSDPGEFQTLLEGVYDEFEDDFDWIFVVNNNASAKEFIPNYVGVYQGVRNKISGIGGDYDLLVRKEGIGSEERLNGIIHFGWRSAFSGPTLHELMHTWGNRSLGSETFEFAGNDRVESKPSFGHWGISNVGGQLGGFANASLKELPMATTSTDFGLGYQHYQASHPDPMSSNDAFGLYAQGGNSVPYSNFELYLMGLISPDDLDDIIYFENFASSTPQEFYKCEGFDTTGGGCFRAKDKITVTAEEFIEKHGQRYPDYLNSQKEFKAMMLVVTTEPLTELEMKEMEQQVAWFSNPADDNSHAYNFYEGTGGRAKIEMDQLHKSVKFSGN